MDRKRKRREGGFSLLEVFIALLILSTGILLLAMVQMTTVVARNPMVSTKLRIATDLAQATLDHFQDVPWGSIRSSHPDGFERERGGLAPAFSRLPVSAGDSVTVQGTAYYRVWNVEEDPETPKLKTITVWCCWRQGESQWHQTVLVTQRADADN